MSEQNKQIARKFYDEVMTGGNVGALDDLIAADFVEHEEFPGLPPGAEGVKAFMSMLRGAFPDLQVKVHEVLAEGDKVVVRANMRGTHQGPFMDIAPTGKQIDVPMIDIVRFADGKAVEHWGLTDQMTMMQQLGAVPAPA